MAMLEFFRANLKYFLTIFYRKYRSVFVLFLLASLVLLIAVNLSSFPYKVELSIALFMPVVFTLFLIIIAVLWKVLYITGYSMGKEGDDVFKQEEIDAERYGNVYISLMIKFFILWFFIVFIIFGWLYFQIIP